jgi:hypothetical protein
MPLLPCLASLWRNLFHRARREAELTAELDAYLEMLIEQKTSEGLTPEAARRAAGGAKTTGKRVTTKVVMDKR